MEELGDNMDIERAKRFWKFLKNTVVVTAATLYGCSAVQPTVYIQRLDASTVIDIADRAAIEARANLSDFNKPIAYYEYTRRDGTWTVFYDGKVARPGNHFMVIVDDRTGKTQIVPGL